MAKLTKKQQAELDKQNAENTGEVKVLPADHVEVEETPAELAVIKKEYGLTLPDEKVEKHLMTFTPFVKTMIDLEDQFQELMVAEANEETAESAAALRKLYRDNRTAAQKVKEDEKEDIVIEGRFLDKLNGVIDKGSKEKEAKLKEVETKMETLELERKAALKETRRAELTALDYETEFMDLAGMPEESYQRLLSKAKEIKEGLTAKQQADEAEALKKAEAEKKSNERIAKMASLGFVLVADTGKYEDHEYAIEPEQVLDASDAEFEETVAGLQALVDDRKKAADQKLAEEKAKQEGIKNRITALAKIGLLFDAEVESYVKGEHVVTKDQVESFSPEDFKKIFDETKTKVDAENQKAKEAQDKLDADKRAADKLLADKAAADKLEADRLAAENKKLKDAEDKRLADEAAEKKRLADEAEAALKAPDKEKFLIFCKEFAKITLPSMTSKAGQNVEAVMTAEFLKLKGLANDLYKTLK